MIYNLCKDTYIFLIYANFYRKIFFFMLWWCFAVALQTNDERQTTKDKRQKAKGYRKWASLSLRRRTTKDKRQKSKG